MDGVKRVEISGQVIEYTTTPPYGRSFFVVWNPISNYPVKRVFDTVEDAIRVAESMARAHDTAFFVLKGVRSCRPAEKPIDTEVLK